MPGAVELEQTGSVAHLQAYEEGLFHIQDISSQLCCSVLAPKPGQTIADLCAAPAAKHLLWQNKWRIKENCFRLINTKAR